MNRSRRCCSPSPCRLPTCSDDLLCRPRTTCLPNCRPLCASPCSHLSRRPYMECQTVPKRNLVSGRVNCGAPSTVCYPRTPGCKEASPRCRDSVCSVGCGCSRPSPPCDRIPCHTPYHRLPTCRSTDKCDEEPSARFIEATECVGPCVSRYQQHLCPWEANVTVSGVVRAHCSSTADEVSKRLSGRFKAFGKRYTTDSLCYKSPDDSCCPQRLSLNLLDDSGGLNLSRNNLPQRDIPNLEYRIRRITGSSDDIDCKGNTAASSKARGDGSRVRGDEPLEKETFDDNSCGRRYCKNSRAVVDRDFSLRKCTSKKLFLADEDHYENNRGDRHRKKYTTFDNNKNHIIPKDRPLSAPLENVKYGRFNQRGLRKSVESSDIDNEHTFSFSRESVGEEKVRRREPRSRRHRSYVREVRGKDWRRGMSCCHCPTPKYDDGPERDTAKHNKEQPLVRECSSSDDLAHIWMREDNGHGRGCSKSLGEERCGHQDFNSSYCRLNHNERRLSYGQ